MGIGDDDTTDTQTAPRRRRFWWSHQVAVSSITHLDVFYGSRTGTAQALATELAQKAVKRGVVVSLNEMNAFDPTHFDEDDAYHSISRASVFVISTYYAGPAPNAESFIQWLRLATEPVKRPTIDVKSSETTNSSAQTDHIVPLPPSKYNRVSPATSPSSAAFQHSPASQCIFHLYWKNLFGGNGGATKTKRKNLCARLQYAVFGVGNSTYLTFNAMGKLVDARLQALAADSFGFFPPNAAELVDNVAQQLGFDLNAYIEVLVHGKDSDSSSLASVESTSESIPFPNVCTVRTVLTNFLELRTISREFVRLASGFVSAPKEHELLETLSSTDGAAAFRQHFTLTKGGVLKLLELAPSLRIPFEVLINMTPLIKPRFHLTATPPLYNGRELDIVVPLREQDDTDGLVATNWQYLLTRPEPGQHLNGINIYAPSAPQVRGFFAESGFTVPSDRSAPMIMIAEGIGVVPFHALVQQRQREDATGSPIKPPARHSQGKNLLFLGCTNRNSLLFEPELLELEKKGAIELHIAFSADAESPKQLVHNLVDGNWQQIRTLTSSSVDSRLYVCGEAAMVRDIRNLVTLNCDDNTNGWCEAAAQSRRYIQNVVP
ncbi:hypothetical protein PRNP1_004316 [Phytophthora ramorum]